MEIQDERGYKRTMAAVAWLDDQLYGRIRRGVKWIVDKVVGRDAAGQAPTIRTVDGS